MFGSGWGKSLGDVLSAYGVGSALDASNPLTQSGPTFDTNKALSYTEAPQQPTQSQKPLGFLAPYANKIPGMQGLGNMMSGPVNPATGQKDYLLPKILAGIGGALQFDKPMRKINPMIGDLLAGQSINRMGGGQAQQPQQPQPQQVAQTPAPTPTARPTNEPAATAPTGPRKVPEINSGMTQLPLQQSQNFFGQQQPNFGSSPQVSGGTVGSPDTATAPVQTPSVGVDKGYEPSTSLADTARASAQYTRPTIDPWTSFMMTGIRPGTNPHTGYTAGNEFLRQSLDEADKRATRETNLMGKYAELLTAQNKPMLNYYQAMEHAANVEKIMGSPRAVAALQRMEAAKAYGEGLGKTQAKQEAAQAIASDPTINSIPLPPALREMGFTSMGQVAAMAEVGSISALDNLIRAQSTIESAYINAKSRVQAANIHAGATVQSTQNQTNQILVATYKPLLTNAEAGMARIQKVYYDPDALKGLSPEDQRIKGVMLKDKLPMTQQIKDEFEGYKTTATLSRNALANLGGVAAAGPATPQGRAAQAPPLAKYAPTTSTPASRRRVESVKPGTTTGYMTVDGVKNTPVYSPDGGRTTYTLDGKPIVKGRTQ